jgi:ribosome-associated translation inhibitor RaiA
MLIRDTCHASSQAWEVMMQIHWVGLSEIDDSKQAQIEARLESLAEGHRDLIDLRITGHQTRHHNHGGKEVRITCQARGREIVAARTEPDQGLALNEVLDVFEREVHRMREKVRDLRRVRAPEPPDLGNLDRISQDEG